MEGPDDREMNPEILIKGNIEDDEKFAYCSFIIFSAILAITFIVLVYITYRVIQLVGRTDKIIPLMLIFLQLSLLGVIAFFI